MSCVTPGYRGCISRAYARATLIAVAMFLVSVLSPSQAAAGTQALAANAERSVAAAFSPVSCLGSPNRWQCVDEYSGSGDDYFSIASSATSSFELGTTTIGANANFAQLHVVSQATVASGCTVTLRLRKSDGTLLGQFVETPATGGFFISSGGQFSVNLNQTDVNGLYLEVAVSVTSGLCYVQQAFIAIEWPDPVTVSGTADNTAICNGSTPVVGIVVNSTKFATVPCTAGTGAFSSSPTFATGDTVTVYYDGVAGGAANAGATWVKAAASSATPITGVQLNRTRYRTEARAAGTPITPTDTAKWDSTEDADVVANATSGMTITDSASTLEIGTNQYNAAGGVVVYKLWVRSGATYNGGAGSVLQVIGAGTGTCDNTTAGRTLCNAGTFNSGTSPVYYLGSGMVDVTSTTYGGGLYLGNGSGAFILGAGGTTITTTSMTIAGGQADTSTYSPNINVNGNLQIDNSYLTGSGTGTITVSGNVAGNGLIVLSAGTFELRNAGAAQTMSPSNALPSNYWRFATLILSTAAGARTVSVPSGSREIRANTLQVGRASDGAVTTFDASASSSQVTVYTSLTLTTRGTYTAAAATEIHGDITSNGTLNAGTGTLYLRGSGTSTVTASGTGNPYDVVIDGPGKTVSLVTGFSAAHALTLDGGSCATPVTLRSSSVGVQRTIVTTTATVNSQYAAFQDIAFTTAKTLTNTGNLGNNSNITFTASTPCAAPAAPYTNTTNASAGSTQPTNINGATAFRMSVQNATGATADRYKARISTSQLDASVLGLWPLDGTTTDRAPAPNTATAVGSPTYTTGATNFGQAMNLDGIDDGLEVATPAAYDVTTFTVELWIRASSLGSAAYPMLAARSGGSTNSQFSLYAQASDGNLIASVSAGGVFYGTSAPIAPLLDNTWHHVAMTVDASKDIRLYVDGIQQGVAIRYSGTLDLPNVPTRVGGSYAGNRFLGAIDDVQFSSGAKSAAELAGYVATKRPHAQTVWSSANIGGDGAALSSTCTTGSRCADIAYSGASIHEPGARYFVSHQIRTAADLWSSWTTDWFETSDAIAVSVPATVALAASSPGTDQTASFSAVTTCTNASGCTLQLAGSSDTVALATVDHPGSIPPITPASPSAPGTWAAGSGLGLGFTVLTSTSGKDTARWGTGTTFASLPALKFVGATRTPTLVQARGSSGVETTSIGMRLNSPPATALGSYEGTFTVIAVANP